MPTRKPTPTEQRQQEIREALALIQWVREERAKSFSDGTTTKLATVAQILTAVLEGWR